VITLIELGVCVCVWCKLTTKAVNASSEAELENRLHALTETLIQKQAMIEALSTEKSSLGLQLERLEVICFLCLQYFNHSLTSQDSYPTSVDVDKQKPWTSF